MDLVRLLYVVLVEVRIPATQDREHTDAGSKFTAQFGY